MKKILVAALLVAARAFGGENLAAAKADSAIKAVFAQFDTCTVGKDAKCAGELFTDDATLVGPLAGAKLVKGKSEIVNALRKTMNDPFMEGVKQKHTVENVRWLGQGRAVVDCSVEFVGSKTAVPSNGYAQTWHATASMVLKGGKWFLEDVRFYFVEPVGAPTPRPSPVPTHPAVPAAPAQPAAPPPPAQPTEPAPPKV